MTAPFIAIERLVEVLAMHSQVARVWLFGSRARGDHADRSDIDLAIEAPGASRREWLDLCHSIEEAETLLAIDLVRLEDAPEALRAHILAEGKLLYER